MKSFFKELFQYSWHYNQELILIYKEQGHTMPEKSVKLLCHVVNAHAIWNSRLQRQLAPRGVWDVCEADLLLTLNKENYDNTLGLLESEELERVVQYTNTKGQGFNNNVRDILFHIINHSTHHRAQIASDLKAAGITPPVSDYIFYKR